MRKRGTLLSTWVAAAVALVPSVALADQTFTLTGTVDTGSPDHVYVDFEVPAGFAEIQIDHDDQSEADILDWGLYDPAGFRGWGGGNSEPIVISADAASRSYLPGPIAAGTWRLVIGKAQLDDDGGTYEAIVTLRDVATLPAQPERSPYEDPGTVVSGARWYVGDFHVHSRESGDARPPIEEIITFAKGRGLDFVELSEHNTTSQLEFYRDAQAGAGEFLLLPGVEFTTYAGHANGIGATAFVDHKIGLDGVTIDGAIDAFHEQGALFSINHPGFELGDACIGCAWGHEVDATKINAVEIVTADTSLLFTESALGFWEGLVASGSRAAAIGGSDDHRAGVDVGAFGTPIGSPATMVYAEELSTQGILDGIRAGHTVVKVRGPEGPMVEIETEEGGTNGLQLVATITDIGEGQQARWVKNGENGEFVALDGETEQLVLDLERPAGAEDRYRVEVREGTAPVTLTSHVWVAAEDFPEPVDEDYGDESPTGGGCTATQTRPIGGAGVTAAALGLAALLARRNRRDARSNVSRGARRP